MPIFGLACEGITDHAVLESIILGTFQELDEDEITNLQPADHHQRGGWGTLLKYLRNSRLKEDLEAVNYIVIQIDTDIANDANIITKDENGSRLSDEEIVLNTINMLETEIKNNHDDFENIKSRLIFAISVESIECWLINSLARDESEYCDHSKKCFETLKELVESIGGLGVAKKKRPHYLRLSRHLENEINKIEELANRDISFNKFITKLKESNPH